MDWLGRNKGWLSGALSVASKVAGLFPGGGLISSVLDIGNSALGLVGGGGGGGGGGKGVVQGGSSGAMIASQAPAVNINLDGVRDEIASIKKETNDIKEALKEQGEQLRDIKEILEDGLGNITHEMSAMRGTIDNIQSTAVKSFEMLKEMNYMDGIENIRSAHSVFFSSSKLGLEKRIQQFENHSFELRKQYQQHMNPQKIGRFLKMLSEESEGDVSAVGMFHYVMTVEAMYLQMMAVYHINSEDMDGFVEQLEMYTDHAEKLIKIMSSILNLDTLEEEFEHNGFTYKNISGFGKVILSGGGSVEQMLPFVSEETVKKPIFKRVKNETGEAMYNIALLWLACDVGDVSLMKELIARGADIDKVTVDGNGYTTSCLCLSAEVGDLEKVQLLLDCKAKMNQGCSLAKPCDDGNEDIVRVLLEAGEDPNRPFFNGQTPLFIARKEGNKGIEKLLLDFGADLATAQMLEKETVKEDEKKKQIKVEEKEKKEEEENENQRRKEEEEKKRKTEPRTIKTRSMTAELREILDKVQGIAGIDDSWHRACRQVFQSGQEVRCDYNPKGNSTQNPMLKLTMPGNVLWLYPYN